MGKLTIKRKSSITGSDVMRAYKIFIDDKEVGSIKSGKTESFELSNGEHSIQLKIDWCSSRKVGFNITDNETTQMECYTSGGGLFSGINALVNKNNYITIKVL